MSYDLSLEVDNLSLSRGSSVLFSGISFSAHKGDIVYVSGSNGSGKSSLLRCLCGLLPKDSGSLRASFSGKSFSATNQDDWSSLFCYLGDRSPLYGHLSSLENIYFWHGLFHKERISRDLILEALGFMGLLDLADLPVEQFSMGQRRRLSLAINMLCPCLIKLLDEPDNTLDKAGKKHLLNLLANYQNRGYITILSSHHLASLKFTLKLDLDKI